MLDVFILLLATAVGYSYLHLRGGRPFAPASSPKGKKERTVLWGLLAIIIVAMVSVFMGQKASNRVSMVLTPFIIGITIFLAFYLKDKNDK